jgi:hypothetical protein
MRTVKGGEFDVAELRPVKLDNMSDRVLGIAGKLYLRHHRGRDCLARRLPS